MIIDVITKWSHFVFFLGFLGNDEEFSGEIFLHCIQKNFPYFFYNELSSNRSPPLRA